MNINPFFMNILEGHFKYAQNSNIVTFRDIAERKSNPLICNQLVPFPLENGPVNGLFIPLRVLHFKNWFYEPVFFAIACHASGSALESFRRFSRKMIKPKFPTNGDMFRISWLNLLVRIYERLPIPQNFQQFINLRNWVEVVWFKIRLAKVRQILFFESDFKKRGWMAAHLSILSEVYARCHLFSLAAIL